MLDHELDKKNPEIFKKIGEKIALKRKKKRRKVQGISKKLNINVDFLDLIEQGEILKIPKHVPRLGFVKSYAKYLEVDTLILDAPRGYTMAFRDSARGELSIPHLGFGVCIYVCEFLQFLSIWFRACGAWS